MRELQLPVRGTLNGWYLNCFRVRKCRFCWLCWELADSESCTFQFPTGKDSAPISPSCPIRNPQSEIHNWNRNINI